MGGRSDLCRLAVYAVGILPVSDPASSVTAANRLCFCSFLLSYLRYLYQGRFLETAVSVYFCFRLHYFCTRHCLFPGSVLHQRSELGFLFSAHDAADYGHFYRHAAICASFPDEDEGPCFRGR